MRRYRWIQGAAVGLAVCSMVLLSACSSSKSSSKPAASGSGSGSSAAAPTGTPIELGIPISVQTTATQPDPELAIAAGAAVKWINSQGGIDGRPVKIDKCDDNFSADGASTCLRTFSDNKNLVAIVGGDDCFSDAGDALLKSSGLPWLAAGGCSANSYTSPQFTLLEGGVVGDSASLGALVGKQKLTAAFFTFNLPQSQSVIDSAASAASALGGTVTPVLTDPAATDMTAYVSAALRKNPQAIIPETSSAQVAGIFQALKQQGYTGKIFASETQLPAALLASLGSLANNVTGATTSTPADVDGVTLPAVTQFVQEMKAEGATTAQITSGAFGAWMSVHEFYDAAKKASSIDRASILASAKALKDWTYGNAMPPITFSAAGPYKQYPNIVMHWAGYLTVQNGKWAWDGQWKDISPGV